MSGQIKTPTNQKLLTNVAVVRMKKCGKRYEVEARDEDCVFEWLAYDPQTRLLAYPPEDSLGPTPLSAAEMGEEGKRQKLIRQLCTKYFVDFMGATHNATLDEQYFQIPTS
ncbi:hypothetical protein GPALN_011082 [Globodera pallida]|uniref:Tudor domain-containing protein n=1 Tax=Globodera pallida TaxID=36090 RepID=A0A183CLJ0_GLOPA|nr:hypothetical protein GPALN_011082 [Globodera pallida]